MTPPDAGRTSSLVVAAALRVEARALRRGVPGLRVLRVGVGPERARSAVARLRDQNAPAVALAGLCGALEPGLAPGDLVVASELRGGEAAGLQLEVGSVCQALRRIGLSARVGPLVTLDHAARGPERKRLREDGAIAADMESAWLAPGAGPRPLAVLRVVLDGPEHELMRPATLRNLWRGLRRLRDAAPALVLWASTQQATASTASGLHRSRALALD